MAIKTICNIFVSDRLDYDVLNETISKYPCNIVLVRDGDSIDEESEIPNLYVGWDFFSKRIKNLSSLKNNIDEKSFWSFSSQENKDAFNDSIDSFLYFSVNRWLPNNFLCFDPITQDVEKFTELLNSGGKTFVYHHNGAIYLYNDGQNFVFNAKNLSIIFENERVAMAKFLNKLDMFAFSYSNILQCCDVDNINDFETLEDFCWIKFGSEINEREFFKLDFPNFDVWRYIPFLMSQTKTISLDGQEFAFLKRIQRKNRVTHKLSNLYVPFDYKFNISEISFINRGSVKFAKFNFSNKRTVTGRIMSKDVFNIQNISKTGEERALIRSRFEGGKIVVMDYKSFETRIATYLTSDPEFIMEYYDKDIHYKTAVMLFETLDITDEQRNFAKTINHAILYGAGDTLINSKLQSLNIHKDKIFEVKSILRPLLEVANKINAELSKKGVLVNKWGTIIRPNKKYAAFNNYIQTAAAEIITDKIDEILSYLRDKASKMLFQVHDSIVFDVHPNEFQLIDEVESLMSNASGMFFPVSIKIGNNYKEAV